MLLQAAFSVLSTSSSPWERSTTDTWNRAVTLLQITAFEDRGDQPAEALGVAFATNNEARKEAGACGLRSCTSAGTCALTDPIVLLGR